MSTKYSTLPAAQKAADRKTHHIRLLGEWYELRIRSLQDEVRKAETKLEEAQEARNAFEAKGLMADKMAQD